VHNSILTRQNYPPQIMENHFTSHDSDTEANVDELNLILFWNINYENNYIALLGREFNWALETTTHNLYDNMHYTIEQWEG